MISLCPDWHFLIGAVRFLRAQKGTVFLVRVSLKHVSGSYHHIVGLIEI
jgi:hypothetical protein